MVSECNRLLVVVGQPSQVLSWMHLVHQVVMIPSLTQPPPVQLRR